MRNNLGLPNEHEMCCSNHTKYDHRNQTLEDANHAFITTALLLKVVRLVIDVLQF